MGNITEFCPECGFQILHVEGCNLCPCCGYSACSCGICSGKEEIEKEFGHETEIL